MMDLHFAYACSYVSFFAADALSVSPKAPAIDQKLVFRRHNFLL
jgi:hypothetical protein